jgi:hypothetical protein
MLLCVLGMKLLIFLTSNLIHRRRRISQIYVISINSNDDDDDDDDNNNNSSIEHCDCLGTTPVGKVLHSVNCPLAAMLRFLVIFFNLVRQFLDIVK